MNFKIKNALYIKLQNVDALEADTALLKAKKPASKLINAPVADKKRAAKEVLYSLLDVATEHEIVGNRKSGAKPKGKGKPKVEATEPETEVEATEPETEVEATEPETEVEATEPGPGKTKVEAALKEEKKK